MQCACRVQRIIADLCKLPFKERFQLRFIRVHVYLLLPAALMIFRTWVFVMAKSNWPQLCKLEYYFHEQWHNWDWPCPLRLVIEVLNKFRKKTRYFVINNNFALTHICLNAFLKHPYKVKSNESNLWAIQPQCFSETWEVDWPVKADHPVLMYLFKLLSHAESVGRTSVRQGISLKQITIYS